MVQMKLVGTFGNSKKRECLLKGIDKYLTEDMLHGIMEDIKKELLIKEVYKKYTKLELLCTDGERLEKIDIPLLSNYNKQLIVVLKEIDKAVKLDMRGELYNEEAVWNGSKHSVYINSGCNTGASGQGSRESQKEDGNRGGTDRVRGNTEKGNQVNGQRWKQELINSGLLYDARPVKTEAFLEAMDRYKRENSNPFGRAVDKHSESEYEGMKCFLWDNGNAGVAVENSGNITSLFKSSNSAIKNFATVSCREAIAKGGEKLDCYSMNHGFLPNKYMDAGMTPVCRIKFNREFAPDGWDFNLMGEPDIVFMAYLGKEKLLHIDFEDYTEEELPYIYDKGDKDAYTLASEYRDRVLDRHKSKAKEATKAVTQDSVVDIIDKRRDSIKEFSGAVSELMGDLTRKIRGKS